MPANEPDPDRRGRSLTTRRQFLRWIPSLGALLAAQRALPASAGPITPDGYVPPSYQVPSASTPKIAAFNMPFRTREEAIKACVRLRSAEEQRTATAASPLEQILGDGSLTSSRLALANWPLLEETEDLSLGNFRFPISPFNITADDGGQQFLLLSNTEIIANFRHREYLEQVHRRIFDRAVWAMDQGRLGTAVVEFDRSLSAQKVERIVSLLAYYGVKTIVWGNELNDPSAPWRDDLPALFEIFSTAANVIRKQRLGNVELCLPGLAFYEFGEYLHKMLRSFKDLQRQHYPKEPDQWPVQRMADHYYGAVEDLLPRVQIIRGILSSEGMSGLKYDLTEVGDPTLGPGQQRATDQQLAEGFVPQISALAVGSGMVDRVVFYSLLDTSNQYSFTGIQDGRLTKKPAYQTFVVMSKLLSRLKGVGMSDEKDLVRLEGTRTDGIGFQVVWSKVMDRELWVDLPRGQRAFGAFGEEYTEERPGQISLKPKTHPALAGPVRIIIGPRS